jgi:hypothetical protein
MQILPPESKIAVRAARGSASESGLVRADAATFVVAEKDRAASIAALPHAGLWKALLARTDRHS